MEFLSIVLSLGIVLAIASLWALARQRKKNAYTRKGENRHKQTIDDDDLKDELLTESPLPPLDYDPTHCRALNEFQPLKSNTACLYAQRAKVWGCPDFDPSLSLEENVRRCILPLRHFCQALQKQKGLEAFVIHLNDAAYCSDVDALAEATCRAMDVISEEEPHGFHFMEASPEEFSFWNVVFESEGWFLTTFAPFYPDTHPRYAYGAKGAFLLLQPESSFHHHGIPVLATKGNARWKVRNNFVEKGGYLVIRVTV